MPEHNQEPPEEYRQIDEVAAVLPTNRHAEAFFDAVVSALGARAWLLEREYGRWLYVRDAQSPGELIPWPLLSLQVGEQVPPVATFSVHAVFEGQVIEPISDEEFQEMRARHAAAIPAPRRGGRKAKLTISCVDTFEFTYDAEGRRVEVTSPGRGSRREPHAFFHALLAAARAGGGVEGFAEAIARLDTGALGPGRVVIADDELHHPDAVWHAGLQSLRAALFDRAVPREPCWLVAGWHGHPSVAWGSTKEAAIANWRAAYARSPEFEPPPVPELPTVDNDPDLLERYDFLPFDREGSMLHISTREETPRPRPTAASAPIAVLQVPWEDVAVPQGLALAGFKRVQPLLGDQGELAILFVRDDVAGQTFIGHEAAAHVDPVTLDDDLDRLLARAHPSYRTGPMLVVEYPDGRHVAYCYRVRHFEWIDGPRACVLAGEQPHFTPHSWNGDRLRTQVVRMRIMS